MINTRYTAILMVVITMCISSCTNNGGLADKSETITTIRGVENRINKNISKTASCVINKSKTASKLFKAECSDSLECSGASLYVRDHTLTNDKEFSITALTDDELAELPGEMANVTGGAVGFRFLPHGAHFTLKEAVVKIPYDSLKIPEGYTEADIHTYYYNEERKRWEVLETDTIDASRQLACSRTTHFPDMVNGILKVPESPETCTLTPTFISDYEPVNPASRISSIDAPQPDASGAANLAYRFKIPQRRAGMAPSLALNYNSDGGTG